MCGCSALCCCSPAEDTNHRLRTITHYPIGKANSLSRGTWPDKTFLVIYNFTEVGVARLSFCLPSPVPPAGLHTLCTTIADDELMQVCKLSCGLLHSTWKTVKKLVSALCQASV